MTIDASMFKYTSKLQYLDAAITASQKAFDALNEKKDTILLSKDNMLPNSNLKYGDKVTIHVRGALQRIETKDLIFVGFEYIYGYNFFWRYLCVESLDPEAIVKAYFQHEFGGKVHEHTTIELR